DESEAKEAEPTEEAPKPADVDLQGHSKPIRGAAWIGDVIVTASEDNTVRFWDAAGQQVRAIDQGAPVKAFAINATGTVLATADDQNQVKIWNVADGQNTRTIPALASAVTSLALNADGLQVAVGSEDNAIRLWQTQTGQL